MRQKNSHIKKHFTLLEIMIGMVLIGIIASVIGINLNEALHKHKYENNIKKFDSYIEFCKKMAFANQADIYMNLSQDEKKTEIEIGTSSDMGFFKNIKKTHDSFNNMSFEFNGENHEKLEIIFTSNGNILTKGKIKFIDVKKKFKDSIEREI
ncbi:MAG: hypothetical protein KR126chlam4_00310 [Candidatus Anoxychlamydiales bacterium]|nr:hypothetical protein [Candidatus Anoxychlamydiales bacterium]NGX40488.1 hypothetical protein [Candidatus Anoxychlamydiales bacterium]HEU64927.1 type II secretion system protein [Chlamydiota bacterium]